MKTYEFTNPETNEVEQIPEERWGWGVVYKPTAEQIKVATEKKEKQDEEAKDKIRDLKNEFIPQKDKLDETQRVSFEKRIADQEKLIDLPIQPVCDELHQFGEDGIFHRIGEVEQERAQLFVLYRNDDPQKKRIDLVVTDGMRLIHKYRNVKPHYMEEFVKIFMFGYKLGNAYHYNFILPDDRIVQSATDDIDLIKFEIHRGLELEK